MLSSTKFSLWTHWNGLINSISSNNYEAFSFSLSAGPFLQGQVRLNHERPTRKMTRPDIHPTVSFPRDETPLILPRATRSVIDLSVEYPSSQSVHHNDFTSAYRGALELAVIWYRPLVHRNPISFYLAIHKKGARWLMISRSWRAKIVKAPLNSELIPTGGGCAVALV